MPPVDHHSQYLARAVAALTPAGHIRVDELLDQLSDIGADREWLVRFAKTRRVEADTGRANAGDDDPGWRLSLPEVDALMTGFITIRDQEPLQDVADWANAVVALLEDDATRR